MPPPPEVGGGSPPVFAGYERAARFQLRNRWVRSSMIARVGSSRLTRSVPYASVAPLNEKEADAARKKGRSEEAGCAGFTGEVLYKSEVARHTLNPIWLPVQFEQPLREKWRSLSCFGLRITAVLPESFQRPSSSRAAAVSSNMDVIIDMRKLFPIGAELATLEKLPPETLLFELSDGTYVVESAYVMLCKQGDVCAWLWWLCGSRR
jgi:hypothetical protein